MSVRKGGTVPRLFSRFVRLCCVGVALLLAQPVQAQAQDPLSFFKNYFVTGDYTVRGVSLFGTGKNVPPRSPHGDNRPA